ncbi:MAG TPA: hypothetical protein PKY77_03945 [Phycisphaerae bacterium]|nr:hypothetical protein [Phycisphaerae bacterium]HRY70930.1 hypothetical protein [Phycisphaerae bacterium]HSA27773.1 hypothetical protein [Phycisphaerae bacterium]
MYADVVRRHSVLIVVVMACSVALVFATTAGAASKARKYKCSDGKCVLVKSAPAVATCRIVGAATAKTKDIGPSHAKAKRTQTPSVQSKHAAASKAVTRKQVQSTRVPKRISSKAERSSRAGR